MFLQEINQQLGQQLAEADAEAQRLRSAVSEMADLLPRLRVVEAEKAQLQVRPWHEEPRVPAAGYAACVQQPHHTVLPTITPSCHRISADTWMRLMHLP